MKIEYRMDCFVNIDIKILNYIGGTDSEKLGGC